MKNLTSKRMFFKAIKTTFDAQIENKRILNCKQQQCKKEIFAMQDAAFNQVLIKNYISRSYESHEKIKHKKQC